MQESRTSGQISACLKKATECERLALLATDDARRKTYLELAHLWRDMARQVEMLRHHSSAL
jgi:hypothetical protein